MPDVPPAKAEPRPAATPISRDWAYGVGSLRSVGDDGSRMGFVADVLGQLCRGAPDVYGPAALLLGQHDVFHAEIRPQLRGDASHRWEPNEMAARLSGIASVALARLAANGVVLVPAYASEHAMLLEIRSTGGERLQLRLFNAGDGAYHHLGFGCAAFLEVHPHKMPSMLQVDDVPAERIDAFFVAQLWLAGAHAVPRTDYVYQWLAAAGGTPRYDLPQRLQRVQRVHNCLLKSRLAWASHTLPEAPYNRFRAALYDAAAAAPSLGGARAARDHLAAKAARARAKADAAERPDFVAAPLQSPEDVRYVAPVPGGRWQILCHGVGQYTWRRRVIWAVGLGACLAAPAALVAVGLAPVALVAAGCAVALGASYVGLGIVYRRGWEHAQKIACARAMVSLDFSRPPRAC